MRQLFAFVAAFSVLLSYSGTAPAQPKPREVIDQALKAMGGAEKFEKLRASRIKTKGHLQLGGDIAFTQDIVTQAPGQFKETLQMKVKDKDLTVTTVYDGKKGWLAVNGETKEADDKILNELKEGSYMLRVGRMLLQDDPSISLDLIGDAKVDGRDTIGIKVSSKGHRDVNIYFDKKTHLLAKMEHRVHDFMKNEDVNEQRIIHEYMDVDGLKVAKKVVIERDGKKFMDIEVQDVKLLESVDRSEFAKP